MAKILFTADLHINLEKRNVPYKWQWDRYIKLAHNLKRINSDYIIFGGDIFDKYPTVQELALFADMLCILSGRRLIIYDGNHEATTRGKTFLDDLRNISKYIHKNCSVITECYSNDLFDIIPYCKLRTSNYTKKNKILLTHVRGEIKPHVKPEINLDKLSPWELVLAGDLHSNSNSQRNIIYPGSPLTVSFHRNPVKTGVIMADTDSCDTEFIELDIPQLIRKTITTTKDIIKTDYDHTIYELKGNAVDIGKAKIDKPDILDKRIVERDSERATLDLSDMTLDEEVAIYLQNILKLPKKEINNIMRTHNDYTKKANI